MRNFEKELTYEPNLGPGMVGNQVSLHGSTTTGWDSLYEVQFAGNQSRLVAVDPQKEYKKKALLKKISYAIVLMVYEQENVKNVVSTISRSLNGAPSGYEKKMLDDCQVAKTNIDHAISRLYWCRDRASQINTMRIEK